MSDAADAGSRLFDGGPFPQWMWGRAAPRGEARIGSRELVAVAIGWLSLALLATAQAAVTGSHEGVTSFLRDLGVHARYLVAAPLLVLAEAFCPKRLGSVVEYFAESGMVDRGDEERFRAAVARTRRLRDSRLVELVLVVAAYAAVYAATRDLPLATLPGWHRTGAGAGLRFSWAGWWHLLVSLPLLLVLLFGWIWRWLLWVLMLWRVSRCRLRLVVAHPDRAGGLRFVSYSTRGFVPIALALGTIVAGKVANGIAIAGTSPAAYKYVPPVLIGIVAVLFAGPPLLFVGRMLEEWRGGAERYGALADQVGRAFERRWLGRETGVGEDALSTPEFSAMTDLYAVVANVYAMGLAPFDLRSLAMLIVAALLPLVPVALLAIPFDTIMGWLVDIFL